MQPAVADRWITLTAEELASRPEPASSAPITTVELLHDWLGDRLTAATGGGFS